MRVTSPEAAPKAIELVLNPPVRDIEGGLHLRRALPSAARRLVGPFIFCDHVSSELTMPARSLDVRPHPHINLATVTFLFEGEFFHRDSLGFALRIPPGSVGWMTAGRGIVHSERTPPDRRNQEGRLHGLQMWVALPRAHEQIEPSFRYYPPEMISTFEHSGAQLRVVAGSAYGVKSPVEVLSPLFYVDARLPAGGTLELTDEYEERAAYVVEGEVSAEGSPLAVGQMAVFKPGSRVTLRSGGAPARVVMIGGAPLDGERHIEWNFVSSSRERIEQAKRDWKEGRFPKVPGDEIEFIPLPG